MDRRENHDYTMIHNSHIVSIGSDSALYHEQDAERGTPEFAMSSSALKAFGSCAKRFISGYEPPATDAKRHGSLLDVRLLVPEIFEARFAVKPMTYENDDGEVKKWNSNSTVCKEWLADHADKEVVSKTEVDNCDEAIARLMEDETIASYLSCSDRQVHLAAEWHDPKTGLVIPIKGLIDLVPREDTEFAKTLGDLKSTRNAALGAWQRWAFQCGYHLQAAFYTDLYMAAFPESDRNTFCFILSENFAPWQVGKRMATDAPDQPDNFVDFGRQVYRRLLANYCVCVATGKWPDYDQHEDSIQGWTLLRAEPFMMDYVGPIFKMDDIQEEPEHQEEATDVVP